MNDSLFDERGRSHPHPLSALAITGVKYVREFISISESDHLIAEIDGGTWSNELSRRVQQYGLSYSYDRRALDLSLPAATIPPNIREIGERLTTRRLFDSPPTQVIVNEYNPGQGIAAHCDRSDFGPVVASLSLLSPIVMYFTNPRERIPREILLEPRSLLVLEGPARYFWRHSIPRRQSDHGIARSRRVSITFRTIE